MQTTACGAVRWLASDGESAAQLCLGNAIALACTCLRSHAAPPSLPEAGGGGGDGRQEEGGDAAEVQRAALEALWAVARQRPSCLDALRAYGGLALALAALRRHHGHAGVQEWGAASPPPISPISPIATMIPLISPRSPPPPGLCLLWLVAERPKERVWLAAAAAHEDALRALGTLPGAQEVAEVTARWWNDGHHHICATPHLGTSPPHLRTSLRWLWD